jgi:hypothetical protein
MKACQSFLFAPALHNRFLVLVIPQMEYSLSGKQTVTAVGAIISLAVVNFFVKLYRHRRAMMSLVSLTQYPSFFSCLLNTLLYNHLLSSFSSILPHHLLHSKNSH